MKKVPTKREIKQIFATLKKLHSQISNAYGEDAEYMLREVSYLSANVRNRVRLEEANATQETRQSPSGDSSIEAHLPGGNQTTNA